MDSTRRYSVGLLTLLVLAMMAFVSSLANAQATSATLTGTVYDVTGAIIPKANVILKNDASGDTRRTVSNGEGYFTFSAVPPGTYSVTVDMDNFQTWQAKSLALNAGDKLTMSDIKLTPGAKKETIVVEANAGQITPVDSGEKSVLIDQKILNNVAIVGQNAAEFIKIMPGMAMTAGTGLNQASYSASDERTGTGPVQDFSANGGRVAALDITSDGAHIIDPGCNCGQAMNTNVDMTSEVKVMTSNFGADSSKGPVVINAIGKSGGQNFHGELYTYSRYYTLNANDWLNIHQGVNAQGVPLAPRPETKYFYPGANIGGPVLIPGTNFNRNHDKLFFFFGTEYYKQDVDNGIYRAVVPTADMRKGIFTDQLGGQNYISWLNGSGVTGLPNNGGPTNNAFSNGVVNPGAINSNGLALMNTYPLDNADPRFNQGFNYVNSQTRFSNMLQFRGRVDYNLSDSTKLYVSFNHQNDNAVNSLDTLWTGNGQSWASPTTPYPSPIVELTHSDVLTANMTKIINPTLTNEVIFSYTYLNLPNSFQDPSKVDRTGLGLNYQLLFNHPNPGNLIFPEMTGWGDGIANQLNSGFELNGTVYAKKTLPSVEDNLSKVWGTHTAKFGFYWERTWNSQPGNGPVNGNAVFANWGGGSSGNVYADMLIGQIAQYNEQNFNAVPEFRYLTTEFYGQDSWKISRRVTLEYGLRVSHLGPWVDTTGFGFAAYYPGLYAQDQGATVNGLTFPGLEWNKANSSTPLSGSGSRAFFYNPRFGFAWDLFGTGKTVLRGGYGMYHYHDEQNVQNGAYGITQGSFSSPIIQPVNLSALSPSLISSLSAPSSITALDPTDTQEPRTQTYSFTVSQRLPWKSVLEVAYVGSKSDYLSNYNNNFDQVNDVGVGALFSAASCAAPGADGTAANGTGTSVCGWLPNCDPTITSGGSSCNTPDGNHGSGFAGGQTQFARPLGLASNACAQAATPNCLGTLKIIDHKMYSNYNGLQMSWNKQAGHFTFMANYTFSKALGIRGENGAATGDPLNLAANYGTLPNNRTQIFNIAYVYELPTISSGNRFLKGAANGWQVSGLAQYQSGVDLQAALNANFGYTAFIAPGSSFMGKTLAPGLAIQANNQNILGTPDVDLQPVLTCDPRKGLADHQYVNGKCFAPFATPGVQGSYIFPTLTGPGFFNTDLSVFKNFSFGQSENKKLTFRFSGYNFLNHPIQTFTASDPGLSLTFDQNGQLQQHGGTTFGFANNKTGHRIVQGEVKFSF